MSLLKKIVTALRGGASEVGEAIVDSQALRILDQEIRDADNNLIDARNQLVKIMAKHKTAQQRITEFDKTIGDWEQKAIAALDKGEEGLAHECAARIADLTNQRDSEQALADQFGASVATLTATVSKTEAQIKGLKQQVDLVKARESVQRAQVSAASATGRRRGPTSSRGRAPAADPSRGRASRRDARSPGPRGRGRPPTCLPVGPGRPTPGPRPTRTPHCSAKPSG